MYVRMLSYAALGAACALGAWVFQGNRYERQLSDLRSEYAQAQVRAVEHANAETIRLQSTKDEAQRVAAVRQSTLARAAVDARNELERVRTSSASALRMSGHSHEACIDRATALKSVFDQCAGVAAEMAERADRHASDVQTLTDAWPK